MTTIRLATIAEDAGEGRDVAVLIPPGAFPHHTLGLALTRLVADYRKSEDVTPTGPESETDQRLRAEAACHPGAACSRPEPKPEPPERAWVVAANERQAGMILDLEAKIADLTAENARLTNALRVSLKRIDDLEAREPQVIVDGHRLVRYVPPGGVYGIGTGKGEPGGVFVGRSDGSGLDASGRLVHGSIT